MGKNQRTLNPREPISNLSSGSGAFPSTSQQLLPLTVPFPPPASDSFPQRRFHQPATSSPNTIAHATRCAICSLEDENVVNQGQITVSGYAVSGGGHGIERVDISVDGGKTWVEAHRYQRSNISYVSDDDMRSDKWAWVLFKAVVDVPENVVIIAKAVLC